jgi:curved DNA-binding protein CbpA
MSSSQAPPIDAYKLFKLSKSFTLEDLRSKYKKLAIALHPDKPNGSEYLFKQVTHHYKVLLKEFEKRQADKQYTELKAQSRTYIDNQPTTSAESKFNVNRFNQVFDENRVSDPSDHGYSTWMAKSSPNRGEIDIRNTMGEFNQDRFNKAFDNIPVRRENTGTVSRYKEPAPIDTSAKIGYSELGVAKLNDFGENTTHRSLNFMDYRRAHSTSRLVDTSTASRKQYRSVEDLERDRSKMSYNMNDRDKRLYERRLREEEDAEKMRIQHQKQKDILIERQYQRVNKLYSLK